MARAIARARSTESETLPRSIFQRCECAMPSLLARTDRLTPACSRSDWTRSPSFTAAATSEFERGRRPIDEFIMAKYEMRVKGGVMGVGTCNDFHVASRARGERIKISPDGRALLRAVMEKKGWNNRDLIRASHGQLSEATVWRALQKSPTEAVTVTRDNLRDVLHVLGVAEASLATHLSVVAKRPRGTAGLTEEELELLRQFRRVRRGLPEKVRGELERMRKLGDAADEVVAATGANPHGLPEVDD